MSSMSDGANQVMRDEDAQNKDALAEAVRRHVKSGCRVETATDYQVVRVKGKRPNHTLHLLLSVFTVTIWAFLVWLPLAIFKREHRKVLQVSPRGHISGRRA